MHKSVPQLAVVPPWWTGFGLLGLAREVVTLWVWRLFGPDPSTFVPSAVQPLTVLVVPGFLMSDFSTRHIRRYLAALGHHVIPAGIGFNFGPTPLAMAQLTARLEKAGGPSVAMVGHSLGGAMCLALARSMPERVSHVVTMCTPIQFPVRTGLAPLIWLMRRRFVVTGADIASAWPRARVLALYATQDGVVDSRDCQGSALDATFRAIKGTHMTMGSNPAAQEAVAEFLSAPL
jgi:pimeloyl-ACP methyl ester carboxylesterase